MIAPLQHKGGNATTSVTVTLPKSPMPNNLLVISVSLVDTGATITVPSGFTAVGTAATSGTTSTSQMYYKTAAVGESSAFTVSKSGTANDVRVVVLEYQGITATSPLDQTGTATSSGSAVTTLTTAAITPTVTNFLIVATFAMTTAANTITGWTSGFVSEDNANSHRQETGDLIVTGSAGSGAYSTKLTWSASGVACCVIASFKVDGLAYSTTMNNRGLRPAPFKPGLAR